MSQEPLAEDVDWVLAQSKCTAATTFERLRAGVGEDLRRRNGLFNRRDGWKFELDDDGDEAFDVVRVVAPGSEGITAVVRFERAGRRIHVHSDELDIDLTAVVTLDAAGLCKLVVGEAMYSEWEVRRMALEQLFFEELDGPE